MTPADAQTEPQGPRSLSHSSRHHRAKPRRLDRPDLRPGNLVWWKSGLFHLESLEQHGEGWMAVLVRPGSVGKPEVECWFAPVRELQYEPG